MITQVNPWVLQGTTDELPDPDSVPQSGIFFEDIDTGTLYILLIDPVTHVHSWQPVGENLDVKQSVRAATTTTLPTYIATADTLTKSTPGALPAIDGVTLVVGDRVLVKDEVGPLAPNNGIYVVTSLGSGSTPWVLTRPADATQGTLTSGAFVFVTEGSTQASTGWVLTTPDPIIVGTTPQTWAQFSGAGTFVAGPGIDITGNVISLQNPNTAEIDWAAIETYSGGTVVPDTAEGVSFTASKTKTRYRITATGITVTLSSTDPDGTTYEFWNATKSATPNTTFSPNGGLKINVAGTYTAASVVINTDWIARAVTKMNGEWWIAS